jgi:four helix bundle protein
MAKALDLVDLHVFQLSERLADQVWTIVNRWPNLARDTVGKQLIRAVDSVGANIAEGFGRGSYQDNRRMVRIARGSLYEARFWLRRAHTRRLISAQQTARLQPLLAELAPRLNAYLKSIGPREQSEARHEAPRVRGGRKTRVTSDQ